MEPSNTQRPDGLTLENNPYKANRPWPPDFEKLDPKHQFRLERRYRRRLRNASSRPNWVKGVKLVQYGSCAGVAIYSVFFMDWGTMGKPFEGVRQWARNALTFDPAPAPPRLHRSSEAFPSSPKSS